MTKTINIDNDDFGAILNCAVRGSLGRHSYMPWLVISFIRPMLQSITERTLRVMERDVREFTEAEAARIKYNPLWDQGIVVVREDLAEWTGFLEVLQAEIEMRGNLEGEERRGRETEIG